MENPNEPFGQPNVNSSYNSISKKTNNPTIPLLGIYPEETVIEKDVCTPVFTAALFTIARTGNQPRSPSTNEQESCGTYIQWNIIQL